MRAGEDTGSTLLLTIFYGFLALTLILVVVGTTSLYLERKRLFTLADGAALAGAEAFDLATVTVEIQGDETTGSPVLRPRLNSNDVRSAVTDYLARVPQPSFDNLTVLSAVSADGQSAEVTLRAEWRPLALAVLLPAGVPLEVTVVARAVFG
jgi:uncharacterized membrane protein